MNGVSGVGLSETMKALGDPVRREIPSTSSAA